MAASGGHWVKSTGGGTGFVAAGSAGGASGQPYRMSYQQWMAAKEAIMAKPSRTVAGWKAQVDAVNRLNYGTLRWKKPGKDYGGMEQEYRDVIAKARREGKLTRAQAKRLIASSRAATPAGA
ncbi:MAG: hypothetical protein GXY76_22965 [Chloroflexi bacterium]|nr:hypothetical protein [Chloroflexota bacterium]